METCTLGPRRPVQTRPEKLIRWYIFSVLIALAPLLVGYLTLSLDRGVPALYLLTARGELLLISTTISSAALGEMLPGGRGSAVPRLIAGGSCVLLVVLSSLFFAAIQARPDPNPVSVFTTSVWLFGCTLFASSWAVYFANEGETP
jgi:hypothetical protein